MRSWLACAGAFVGALLVAAPAGAASGSAAPAVTGKASPAGASGSGAGLYIAGAGFGHGIGMSQYGAAGDAQHGYSYRQILQDYYAQTTVGQVNPGRTVTVLLKSKGAAAFSGATRIRGTARKLRVTTNYSVLVVGARLRVISGGRTIGTYSPPLQVSGPGPLKLIGMGSYRGALVFRPSTAGSGVMTVNALGLDNYVRGVVSAEMPSGWPQQALEAQAIAARTYAITAGSIGANFELYDDTRSQMYEGVAAESPPTNAAIAATRGQIVEYDGAPAVTYFFASSGGQTESVQNVWAGVAPEAWLVSKADPYDDSYNNPYYRWNTSLSVSAAASKLGRLVNGQLVGINVLQRGASPRVVQAQIVGSNGTTTASGAQLQADLGTPSTWMSFTSVSAQGVEAPGPVTPAPPAPAPTSTGATPPPTTGGTGLRANILGRVATEFAYAVSGTIYPVTAGATVTVQYETAAGWTFAGTGQVAADGTYSVGVLGPGIYRVLYDGIVGPTATVN